MELVGSLVERLVLRPLDALLSLGAPTVGSNPFLKANYAPLQTDTGAFYSRLEVQGTIPAELVGGMFVRNGPNPRFIPNGLYHWFDGDGMLHGVRFHSEGHVSFAQRYVDTERRTVEQSWGRKVHLRIGELVGWMGLLRMALSGARSLLGITAKEGGTANTALEWHNRQLLALVESSKPTAVRVTPAGDLVTRGLHTYDGKLKHTFTAHPKVDPVTGEMIFFGANLNNKGEPYFHASTVSAGGELVRTVPVTLPDPVMMHDFGVTENYIVVCDLPLHFQPNVMVKEGRLPFTFVERPSRFGLLPRRATSEADIRWFESGPCFFFHVMNAWEEGDVVVLQACRTRSFKLEFGVDEMNEASHMPALYEWRFNLTTGSVDERELLSTPIEFPRVDPRRLCRSTRIGYASRLAYTDKNSMPAFDGCVKVDLATGSVLGEFDFGENRHGGECVFVPRGPDAAEDDGFLLTYTHQEGDVTSSLFVWDAKTMASSPLVVIKLPERIPWGFHGMYISADQLKAQLPS